MLIALSIASGIALMAGMSEATYQSRQAQLRAELKEVRQEKVDFETRRELARR